MKVTREPAEFKKVTVVLETEQDVLNLYRLTCDNMYEFLIEKYGFTVGGNVVGFKERLHSELSNDIPEDKQ